MGLPPRSTLRERCFEERQFQMHCPPVGGAHDGTVVGLFIEGTRMKTGRPGPALPGAAMVALQEDVPVIPVAIYGTLWAFILAFTVRYLPYGMRYAASGILQIHPELEEAAGRLDANDGAGVQRERGGGLRDGGHAVRVLARASENS